MHCLSPNSPQPRFGKAGRRKKGATDAKSIQLAIQNLFSLSHAHKVHAGIWELHVSELIAKWT